MYKIGENIPVDLGGVTHTMCILKDMESKIKHGKEIYCVANLAAGTLQANRFPTVRAALDFIERNWEIENENTPEEREL